MDLLRGMDMFRVNGAVWVASRTIHVPAYDFSFEPLLQLDRPRLQGVHPIVARVGAIPDYEKLYRELAGIDFKLINSPSQHVLASELEHWYPLIREVTPKSQVFDQFPEVEELLAAFELPVFIKGNRQTAKHQADLSIARTREDLERISTAYREDPILHWQKVVVREFVELAPLEGDPFGKVPLSYEFRTFWWKGQLVGEGHYWSQYLEYRWTDTERKTALDIGEWVAHRVEVPFLVIDLALTQDGRWIVIELNDAQESGYAGVDAFPLWRKIVELEGAD